MRITGSKLGYLITGIAIIVAMGILFQGCGRKDAVNRYNKGVEFFDAGNYAAAAIEFQNSLQNDPGFTRARFGLALCLIRQGQSAAAEQHLRRVVQDDPTHLEARIELIPYQIVKGEIPEAIRTVDDALAQTPKKTRALLLLSSGQLERGGLSEALGAIERALELEPNNHEYLNQYVRVCLELGARTALRAPVRSDLSETPEPAESAWEKRAETTLERILEADPQNFQATILKSQLLSLQGHMEQAQEVLLKAEEIRPQDESVQSTKINFLFFSGEFDAAVEKVRGVLASGVSNPNLEAQLAQGLVAQAALAKVEDRVEDASRKLEEARILLERNRAEGPVLSYVLAMTGKTEQARNMNDRLIDRPLDPPTRLRLLFTHALLNLKSRNEARAEAVYNILQNEFPDSMETWRLTAIRKQPSEKAQELADRIYTQEGPTFHSIIGSVRQMELRQRRDKVEKMLEMAKSLAPDSPLPDFLLGSFLAREREKSEESLAALEQAYQKDNLFPPVLLALADHARGNRDFEKSIAFYEEFLQLIPNDRIGKTNLALTLASAGYLTEASRMFDEILKDNPEPLFFAGLVGLIDRAGGMREGHLDFANQLIARNPDSVFGQVLRFFALRDQARREFARNDLEEGRRLLSQAEQSLEAGLRRDPASVLILQLQSEMYSESGDQDRSIGIAERVLRLRPEFRPALLTLVSANFQKRDFARALEVCESALEKRPEDTDFLFWKARILDGQGRLREAEKALRQLQRRDPLNPRHIAMLSRLVAQQGRRSEAMGILEGSIALQPLDPLPYLQLAEIQMRAGQFSESEKNLRTALEQFPDNPLILLALGELYSARGDRPRAMEQYRRILRSHPDEPEATARLLREMIRAEQDEEVQQLIEQREGDRRQALTALLSADIATQMNRLDFAQKMYEFAQGKLTDPSPALVGLARVAASRREKEKSLEYYDSVIRSVSPEHRVRVLIEAADVASASWDQPPSVWQDQLRKAESYLLQASEMTAPTPNSQALARLARIASMRGDSNAEEQYLTRVLEIEPDNTIFQILLARVKERNGKTEEAREIIEQLLAKITEAEDPTVLLSNLAGDLAVLVKSDQSLLDTFKARREDYVARILLGIVDLSKAREPGISLTEATQLRQQALNHFMEVKRMRPDSPLPYRLITSVLAQLGDENQMKKVFEEWLQVRPSDTIARIEYARNLVRTGDSSGALKALDQVIELESENTEALLAKALIYATTEINRQDESETLIRNILKLQPNHARSALALMSLLKEQQRQEDATIVAKSFLENNPGNFLVVSQLGAIFLEMMNYPEAVRCYERALAISPHSPEAMNNLAYTYAKAGMEMEKARTLAQRSLNAIPGNPNILDTLGFVYLQSGETARAIDVFHEVLEKRPDLAATRYHLAIAYEREGNRTEARKQLEQALTQDFTMKNEALELKRKLEATP